MSRFLTFLLTLLLLTTPTLAASTTDTTVQPPNYEWLLKHGWVEQVEGRYVVDSEVWQRNRRKYISHAVLGSVLTVPFVGLTAIVIRNEVNGGTTFPLVFNALFPIMFGAGAGVSYAFMAKSKREYDRLQSQYQPYTITPQISRNGGGLEVAWKW